jgi:serine/threonine protein kinase
LFTESVARFCTSQVLLALQFLHSKNVIYRDLKPENLLVTINGYLKLADFGFAKYLAPGTFTYTICGTPEYIAPEMVRHVPHSNSVDWWTLGILVHEMLMGITPFADKREQQDDLAVYKRIADFQVSSLKLSKRLSMDAQDFIKRLLDSNPAKRLGHMSTGGAVSVKNHPWLMLLHWPSLIDQTFLSPFNPNVSHSGDPRNFRCYQHSKVDDDEEEEEHADIKKDPEDGFPDF